ncbi:DUF5615 family PIN-like protein [Hyphomonadaceae bacterium ML37]|nr:DUF5615 family PIN-like protein [Hyphomonadaceae bacterium ML37]
MRFLIDECVPREIANALARAGHDVTFVSPDHRGADDFEVANLAIRTARILVTTDNGFGDIAFRHGVHPPAIILLRTLDEALIVQAVEQQQDTLFGCLTVITQRQARSRKYE